MYHIASLEKYPAAQHLDFVTAAFLWLDFYGYRLNIVKVRKRLWSGLIEQKRVHVLHRNRFVDLVYGLNKCILCSITYNQSACFACLLMLTTPWILELNSVRIRHFVRPPSVPPIAS